MDERSDYKFGGGLSDMNEYRIINWGSEVSISTYNVETDDILTLKHTCTIDEAFEWIKEQIKKEA